MAIREGKGALGAPFTYTMVWQMTGRGSSCQSPLNLSTYRYCNTLRRRDRCSILFTDIGELSMMADGEVSKFGAHVYGRYSPDMESSRRDSLRWMRASSGFPD